MVVEWTGIDGINTIIVRKPKIAQDILVVCTLYLVI